jgi:hypothetical protein
MTTSSAQRVHSRVPSCARRASLIAALLAATFVVSCRGGGDDSATTVTWSTTPEAHDGSIAVVGAEVPRYVPPPFIDIDRLNALLRIQSLPEDASILAGSEWDGSDIPLGEPSQLMFLGNMLTITQRDGRTMSMMADYSALHPRCHGYPLCVVTLNTNGALSVNFLHLEAGTLRFAECMSFDRAPAPSDADLAASNAVAVYRHDTVVCFYYTNSAVYYPPYPTEEELAEDENDRPDHDLYPNEPSPGEMPAEPAPSVEP